MVGTSPMICAWTHFSLEVYSLGTISRNPDSGLGFATRSKLPTTAHKPAAGSVSIPRKHRNRAITGA
jgi:hypothetical protein